MRGRSTTSSHRSKDQQQYPELGDRLKGQCIHAEFGRQCSGFSFRFSILKPILCLSLNVDCDPDVCRNCQKFKFKSKLKFAVAQLNFHQLEFSSGPIKTIGHQVLHCKYDQHHQQQYWIKLLASPRRTLLSLNLILLGCHLISFRSQNPVQFITVQFASDPSRLRQVDTKSSQHGVLDTFQTDIVPDNP